jgi:hypothetical protein
MKNLSKISLAPVFAVMFTLANNAFADGIAASPKVQQMLNERAARSVASAPASTITYRTPGLDGITASPKVRQTLANRKVVVGGAPAVEVTSAGYNPSGMDEVAASPRLRSQLNERSTPIVIAPLK